MIAVKKPATMRQLSLRVSIPVPTDKRFEGGAGSRWRGLDHHDLVTSFQDQVRDRGWSMLPPLLALTAHGHTLTASFDLDRHREPLGTDEYRMAVGLVNDNTRRKGLRVYYGLHHQTGVGFPLFRSVRKHTKRLTPDQVAEEVLDFLVLAADKLVRKRAHLLLNKPIEGHEVAHLLVTAGQQGWMPWSRLGRVERYFGAVGSTYWNLLFAFAQAAQLNPVDEQMDQIWHFSQAMPQK